MLTNDDIKKYIAELQVQSNNDIPDSNEIKKYWADIMRDDGKKDSVRMSASINLAKAQGMFREDAAWSDI